MKTKLKRPGNNWFKLSWSDKYANTFRYLLPTPLAIAFILTVLAFIAALFIPHEGTFYEHIGDLAVAWKEGLWNNGLIVFAFQMMLMLVLGHILALSKPVGWLINLITRNCSNAVRASVIVAACTILVSFINWGLGLIFGAILARKVGEYATLNSIKINYPLVGAAGYSGLMVWHGGISGSSLTKVAEKGHIKSMMANILPDEQLSQLPDQISFNQTVFSPMNIVVAILLLVMVPLVLAFISRKSQSSVPELSSNEIVKKGNVKPIGMERFDHSRITGLVIGSIIVIMAAYEAINAPNVQQLGFINPNYINFTLLGLCFLFHGSLLKFLSSLDDAIAGTSGILIQFPLYFGIMGIMTTSGLVGEIARFFEDISNPTSYPVLTFLSAGIVNVFVPSGGGQWAIQGPIIIQAAIAKGISLPKCILAMAYGDQLTNMLQPFWALPLLGITKLSAKQILPYTLIIMLVGIVVFISGLLLF